MVWPIMGKKTIIGVNLEKCSLKIKKWISMFFNAFNQVRCIKKALLEFFYCFLITNFIYNTFRFIYRGKNFSKDVNGRVEIFIVLYYTNINYYSSIHYLHRFIIITTDLFD
ncbi:hypothetical protein GCM10025860_19470 [Methanobacterium ferruginis]|nr:hypothetical protein GCM10025860_19470 [Methanobacterium ferruginis]